MNGATVTLTYNEALDPASTPVTTAFAVKVNDVARGISGVAISGSVVTLTLASPVVTGNTVTVGYTKPVSGAVLQDVAGNDAMTIVPQTVTNNTGGGDDTAAGVPERGGERGECDGIRTTRRSTRHRRPWRRRLR